MTVMTFNPADWYWLADDGRLFSSARAAIVGVGDARYQEWRSASGFNVATIWPRDDAGNQTIAALQAVMSYYGLYVDLAAYAEAKQQAIAQGGFTVNANTSGAALEVHVDTTPAYANYLASAVQLAQLMAAGTIPSQAINWVQTSGTVALTPAQIITVGVAVAALVQQSFTVLGEVKAAIAAGTITSKAQVDSPPSPIPAWPANS